MTAQELAEQLEVSERTIYRDIEALSFAGIPLYTERGPGGGCALLDGYQTRLTGLTTREVRALFLLSTAAPLTDLGLDQALEDALLKLSAALPAASREQAAQVRQRIHMDTGQSARPGISHLQTLQEAIWHECLLCLTYRDRRKYLIEPYALVTQNGAWYLIGANSGTMQVVRLAHIHAAEVTEQHFTRSPAFDLATYWAEHTSRIYHAPVSSRGSHPQKKAKMKSGSSAPRTRQTALARNKKTNFHFSRMKFRLAIFPTPLRPASNFLTHITGEGKRSLKKASPLLQNYTYL